MLRTNRAGGRRAGLAVAATVLAGGILATVAPTVAQAASSVRPKVTQWCITNAWATTKTQAIATAEIIAGNEGCNIVIAAYAVPQSQGGVPGYEATVQAVRYY